MIFFSVVMFHLFQAFANASANDKHAWMMLMSLIGRLESVLKYPLAGRGQVGLGAVRTLRANK